MSKIKNGGLDQYGAEPFEQQQFGTTVVEGVKVYIEFSVNHVCYKQCVEFVSLVCNVLCDREDSVLHHR